jgi:hypothetical protein
MANSPYSYDRKCLLCVAGHPHYSGEHEREIARTDRFNATGRTLSEEVTELLNPAYAKRLRRNERS